LPRCISSAPRQAAINPEVVLPARSVRSRFDRPDLAVIHVVIQAVSLCESFISLQVVAMTRIFLGFALLAAFVSAGVQAETTTISSYVPSAEQVGKARLRYLLLDIYDATLLAPNGDYEKTQPFALSLDYLRKLNGDAIAKRTIKEIRGQGFSDEATLDRWFAEIVDIFPDVQKGSNITGVLDDDRVTHFFFDGKKVGSIKDPDFGPRFFDIWLGEKSSQAKMRDRLIGKKP